MCNWYHFIRSIMKIYQERTQFRWKMRNEKNCIYVIFRMYDMNRHSLLIFFQNQLIKIFINISKYGLKFDIYFSIKPGKVTFARPWKTIHFTIKYHVNATENRSKGHLIIIIYFMMLIVSLFQNLHLVKQFFQIS